MSAAGRLDTGFTLLEMLVVLAGLGLIGGLVYPALTPLREGERFRDAESQVAVILDTARANAIRTTAPTRVDASSLPTAGQIRMTISPRTGILFYTDGSANGGTVDIRSGTRASRYTVLPATGAISRSAS